MKNGQKSKRGLILSIAACAVVVLLLLIAGYRDVIFQRGNPIPYLVAAMGIGEKSPYVEVGSDAGVYISKLGECPELIEFVERSKNAEFVERAGSAYLFTDGSDSFAVSSEVYWRYFTVWVVP